MAIDGEGTQTARPAAAHTRPLPPVLAPIWAAQGLAGDPRTSGATYLNSCPPAYQSDEIESIPGVVSTTWTPGPPVCRTVPTCVPLGNNVCGLVTKAECTPTLAPTGPRRNSTRGGSWFGLRSVG